MKYNLIGLIGGFVGIYAMNKMEQKRSENVNNIPVRFRDKKIQNVRRWKVCTE